MRSFKKKKSQCFWLVKYWWNLISCLICTKPIFKQVLLTYLLTHQKKWGVGWKWTTGGIVLITCPFLKLRLPCKSFYLGCLLTFFFPNCTFFLLSGGLGLIGHPLIIHGCRVLQRNQFCFHEKYLYYLEYFQDGNGLLG